MQCNERAFLYSIYCAQVEGNYNFELMSNLAFPINFNFNNILTCYLSLKKKKNVDYVMLLPR